MSTCAGDNHAAEMRTGGAPRPRDRPECTLHARVRRPQVRRDPGEGKPRSAATGRGGRPAGASEGMVGGR